MNSAPTTTASEIPTARAPGTVPALVGDPFRVLSLEEIREVRNEALKHYDGDTFALYGYTFVVLGALLRANSRLMLANMALCVQDRKETPPALEAGKEPT